MSNVDSFGAKGVLDVKGNEYGEGFSNLSEAMWCIHELDARGHPSLKMSYPQFSRIKSLVRSPVDKARLHRGMPSGQWHTAPVRALRKGRLCAPL